MFYKKKTTNHSVVTTVHCHSSEGWNPEVVMPFLNYWIPDQVWDDKASNKFKRGFGVVEVLVSSVIIITILMALVFVGRTALANSSYTQEKAQAVYLAQEGIEIVRQIRDTNWIDGNNATNFGSLAAFSCSTSCKVDFASSRYSLVSSSTGESISVNNLAFSRTIKIEGTGNSLFPLDGTNGTTNAATNVYPATNALKVTSIVTWTFNGVQKSVSASEVLTNWRPNF